MGSDIVLGSALRNTLLSNIQTQRSLDQTTLRLATGLAVNSALDNPQNFFAAQSLTNRSGDLQRLLDGIGQSTRTIQEADIGISALSRLIGQAEAIAQEAVELNRSAPTEARISGNIDLTQVKDLTDIDGITNGDRLMFSFRDPDTVTYFPFEYAVTINNGDNVDQLVAEINALNNSFTTDVINADVDANGYLEIKILDDSRASIKFLGNGGTNADHLNLASAIGFGDQARLLTNGNFGADEVQFNFVAKREIQSFQLFNAASNETAVRSDQISQLEAANNTLIFTGLNAAADQFEIGVNYETRQSITIDADQTIQGLLDNINNGALNDVLEAGFDEEEGRITIRAINDRVQSIETALTSNSVAISFFGFTTETPLVFTGTDEESTQLGIASGPDAAQIALLESDFNNIRTQVNSIVDDAHYRGINLLAGDDLITSFNESRTNELITQGRDFTALGLGVDRANFDTLTNAANSVSQSRNALQDVRSFGQSIANDLSIIQTREDFTRNTINTLEAGSDDLTVADQNEEGAQFLALQTRQAIAINVLSFLGAQQGEILSLFA